MNFVFFHAFHEMKLHFPDRVGEMKKKERREVFPIGPNGTFGSVRNSDLAPILYRPCMPVG
jgi:hypothetical protein